MQRIFFILTQNISKNCTLFEHSICKYSVLAPQNHKLTNFNYKQKYKSIKVSNHGHSKIRKL